MSESFDINLCTQRLCKEFVSCNVIGAKVATNGYQGGDSGHGSRTYFCLDWDESTDIDVRVSDNKIEIMLGGDCELKTFNDALKWSSDTLSSMTQNPWE